MSRLQNVPEACRGTVGRMYKLAAGGNDDAENFLKNKWHCQSSGVYAPWDAG